MTWRTFTAWLLFSSSALWVAAANDSEVPAPAPTAATTKVTAQPGMIIKPFLRLTHQSIMADPRQVVALIIGLSACFFTYQRMWQNLRKS